MLLFWPPNSALLPRWLSPCFSERVLLRVPTQMFVQNSKFLGFDAVAAWWPESVQSVRSFLDQTRIVILWQCPKVMVEELQPYVFRTRPFWTPLVDLSLSEDALWRR